MKGGWKSMDKTSVMRVRLCCLYALSAIAPVSAARLSDATYLRMGAMSVSPVIDGTISRKESQHSSVQYGPVSSSTKLMMLRYGTFYVGYTKGGFYFAARTSLPVRPQKLTDTDRVTFTLQAPGTEIPVDFTVRIKDGEARLPLGAVARVRHLKGIADYGVLCAETEMFVPYKVFGVSGIEDGDLWGLQMRVDYSSEQESGFWHLPNAPGELGTLVADSSMPVSGLVNFDYLECWKASNTYMISLRFDNVSGKAVRLTSRSDLKRGVGFAKLNADAEKSKDVIVHHVKSFDGETVEAGKVRDFTHTEWSVWPGSVNILQLEALAGAEVCYRRRLPWEHNRGIGWKDDSGSPTLNAAFYPSAGNRFVAQYHVNKTDRLVRGQVSVSGPEGRVFLDRKFKGSPFLKDGRIDTHLGDLPVGDYVAKFTAVDVDGLEFTDERTFEVRKFPWQGNALGKDRVIVPPFKPICEDGRKIEFLQTGYAYGGILWSGVVADGENILAAPVDLVMNGRRFSTVSTRIVASGPDHVVREVSAVLDDMKLTVRQDYDYDGFCLVAFEFAPDRPVKIENLRLDIPVKDEFVKIYNACGRGDIARSGPMIDLSVPAGKGEVWNSDLIASKWEKIHFNVNFQPYLWIGDGAVGLAWLMENMSSGYSLDPSVPMQRIVRSSGAATLSIAIVNRATVWDGPVRFRMGFQPTPVKPRNWGFQNMAVPLWTGYSCPSNATQICCNGESAFQMDTLTTAINTYPGDDRSFLKWVLGTEEPRNVDAYRRKLQEYVDRNSAWFEECAKSPASAFVSRNHTFGALKIHQSKAVCCYFNPLITSCYWPEYEMYKSEWSQWNWPQDNHFGEYDCKISPSRIDKLMYDAHSALKDGFKGIYFDCFGCHRDYNYVINPGNAYLKPDGSVQMSVSDLLAQRELVKRAATLCYLNGACIYGVPYVEIHTTDCMVVPVVSFGAVAITQERGAKGGEYHERYPESYIKADTLGIQAGLVPRVIAYARLGNAERRMREFNTLVTYMCAFGYFSITDGGIVYSREFERLWNAVFDFGWGKPYVTPYFSFDRKPAPVRHSGSDVRMTLGVKDGAALMLFGNLGEETAVSFDLDGLGFSRAKVTNVATGETLAGNTFILPRRGHAGFLVEACRESGMDVGGAYPSDGKVDFNKNAKEVK